MLDLAVPVRMGVAEASARPAKASLSLKLILCWVQLCYYSGIRATQSSIVLNASLPPLLPPIPPPRVAVQIIFHKENPGIDYEFYVPVEKKEEERERPKDREREAPRTPPREKPREHEQARAPLRSKYPLGELPRSVWQLCPKAALKQLPGWTCVPSSCSRDPHR